MIMSKSAHYIETQKEIVPVSELLREAIRLYMDERAWLRQERRETSEVSSGRTRKPQMPER